MIEWIQSIDTSILFFVQNNVRNDILTPIMVFFSLITKMGAVWLALGVVLLFFKKHRKLGFMIIFCIAVTWIIGDEILKPIIARPRPYNLLEGLIALDHENSFSFPSGHSSSSFAAATVMARMRGKKGALIFIPATIVALSRIYVAVHNPSDVLAGILLGVIVSLLVMWLIFKFFDKPLSKLLRVEHGY